MVVLRYFPSFVKLMTKLILKTILQCDGLGKIIWTIKVNKLLIKSVEIISEKDFKYVRKNKPEVPVFEFYVSFLAYHAFSF